MLVACIYFRIGCTKNGEVYEINVSHAPDFFCVSLIILFVAYANERLDFAAFFFSPKSCIFAAATDRLYSTLLNNQFPRIPMLEESCGPNKNHKKEKQLPICTLCLVYVLLFMAFWDDPVVPDLEMH